MKAKHRRASAAKRSGRFARDPTAFWRTLGRGQEFTDAERDGLNLPVRIAYERVRTGTGIEGDFDTLAAAINVALICAERIDPLVEQSCIEARDALLRMHERYARMRRWGLDGPGLQQVLVGIEVYEQLTHMLKAGQIEDALREAVRRMEAGLYMEGAE